MALTLDQLQEQRDQIIAAMSGPQHVQFKGRSETQRPQNELEAALQRIDAEIARLSQPSQSRVFVVTTKRGIE